MACWSICARCLVKFRKWLLQRESSPTSPQTGRINRDPRLEEPRMVEDRFLKRHRKKARKGLRGGPIATVAFYGPNLHQATKAAVGIVPSENSEVEELRAWLVDRGDIRSDPGIAREILEFIEEHQVRSVAITDGIIGCPHQEGIDYEGEWCAVCEFWHGRYVVAWIGCDCRPGLDRRRLELRKQQPDTPRCRLNTTPNTVIISRNRAIGSRTGRNMTRH